MWQRFLFQRVKEKTMIRLNDKSCLHSRYKHSSCDSCIKDCPYDAISLTDSKVKLDEDLCRNCHLCINSCPTEALYYGSEMMDKYENRISQKEAVTFTCVKQCSKEGHDVALPCLSELSPEHLMISEMYGKQIDVYCNDNICNKCNYNWNPDSGLTWMEDWNSQSFVDKQVSIVSDTEEKVGRKRTYNRRELFQMTTNETKSQIGDFILDSYKEVTNLRDKVSQTQKRKYAMEYFNRKKELLEGENLGKLPEILRVTNLKVTEECSICPKCSSICPTGALKVEALEDDKLLLFHPDKCIDCDICEKVCDHITKEPLSSWFELLKAATLRKIKQNNCPKCGDEKNINERYCEDCEMKENRKQSLFTNW